MIKNNTINVSNFEYNLNEIQNINLNTYNSLASEYNNRWRLYIKTQEAVLKPFEELIVESRSNSNSKKVLDVGCGVGLDSYLLSKNGLSMYGIDISPKMVKFAKINAPNANITIMDFFKINSEKKFNGILLDAFLHIFPKPISSLILKKAQDILEKNGFILITSTISEKYHEGFLAKTDYTGNLVRYRKYWLKEELQEAIRKNKFKIYKYYEDFNLVFNKSWMNFLIHL